MTSQCVFNFHFPDGSFGYLPAICKGILKSYTGVGSWYTCHNVGEILFYNNGRERRHLVGRRVGKFEAIVMIYEPGQKLEMIFSRCACVIKVVVFKSATALHFD